MTTPSQRAARPSSTGMAKVVERNIAALLAHRQQKEQTKRWQDAVSDIITRFTGSLHFVYLHLALFSLWVVINLVWTPLPQFDPSFVILAMVASVESIFLSTFVLISQNRMAALADQRADLDLHISLLAEHEVTRLITLVIAIADRLGIDIVSDPELVELAQDVAPEDVLQRLGANAQQSTNVPSTE